MKSLVVPFDISGGHVADTQSLTKIVEQKIINVLVTGPGERIALPQYGSGVQQLLFAPIDDLTEVDFKTDAQADLQGNISNLRIVNISILPIGVTEAQVTVYYQTPLSTTQATTFTVSLPGQLTEESPI